VNRCQLAKLSDQPDREWDGGHGPGFIRGGLAAAGDPLNIPLSGPAANAVTRGYHLYSMPGNRLRVRPNDLPVLDPGGDTDGLAWAGGSVMTRCGGSLWVPVILPQTLTWLSCPGRGVVKLPGSSRPPGRSEEAEVGEKLGGGVDDLGGGLERFGCLGRAGLLGRVERIL
jgi:hypothetical protein